MYKRAYFANYRGSGWPSLDVLKPYFFEPPHGRGWFHDRGNDSAGFDLFGVDGTAHLQLGQGRIDTRLDMWGNPDLGVLLIYTKRGGGYRDEFSSKGDLARLKEWVRTTHDDPMPIGLYISFDQAWLAVKEFIETEGQLPTSIEWVKNADLPPGTFPDP